MSLSLIVYKFVTVAHLITRFSHTGQPFCLVLLYVTSAYIKKKIERDIKPWLIACIDEASVNPQIGLGTRRTSEVNNPTRLYPPSSRRKGLPARRK
jgi:hypothetical protein